MKKLLWLLSFVCFWTNIQAQDFTFTKKNVCTMEVPAFEAQLIYLKRNNFSVFYESPKTKECAQKLLKDFVQQFGRGAFKRAGWTASELGLTLPPEDITASEFAKKLGYKSSDALEAVVKKIKSNVDVSGSGKLAQLLKDLGIAQDDLEKMIDIYKELGQDSDGFIDIITRFREGKLTENPEDFVLGEEEEDDDEDDDGDVPPPPGDDDDDIPPPPGFDEPVKKKVKREDQEDWGKIFEIIVEVKKAVKKIIVQQRKTAEEVKNDKNAQKASDEFLIDQLMHYGTIVEPGKGIYPYFLRLKQDFDDALKNNNNFVHLDEYKKLFDGQKDSIFYKFLEENITLEKMEELHKGLSKDGGGDLLNKKFIPMFEKLFFDKNILQKKKEYFITLLVNFIVSIRKTKSGDRINSDVVAFNAIELALKQKNEKVMEDLAKRIDILRANPKFLKYDGLIGQEAMNKMNMQKSKMDQSYFIPLLLSLRLYEGASIQPKAQEFKSFGTFIQKLNKQLFFDPEELTFSLKLDESLNKKLKKVVNIKKESLVGVFDLFTVVTKKIKNIKNKIELIIFLGALPEKKIDTDTRDSLVEELKKDKKNIKIDFLVSKMNAFVGKEIKIKDLLLRLIEKEETLSEKIDGVLASVKTNKNIDLYSELKKIPEIKEMVELIFRYPYRNPFTVRDFLKRNDVLGANNVAKYGDSFFVRKIKPYGLLIKVLIDILKLTDRKKYPNKYIIVKEVLKGLSSVGLPNVLYDLFTTAEIDLIGLSESLKTLYFQNDLFKEFQRDFDNKTVENTIKSFNNFIADANMDVEKTPMYHFALIVLRNLFQDALLMEVFEEIQELNKGENKIGIKNKVIIAGLEIPEQDKTSRKKRILYKRIFAAIKGKFSLVIKILNKDIIEFSKVNIEEIEKSFETAKKTIIEKIKAIEALQKNTQEQDKFVKVIKDFFDKSMKKVISVHQNVINYIKEQKEFTEVYNEIIHLNHGFGVLSETLGFARNSYIIKTLKPEGKKEAKKAEQALSNQAYKKLTGLLSSFIIFLGTKVDSFPAKTKIEENIEKIKETIEKNINTIKIEDVLPTHLVQDTVAKEKFKHNVRRRVVLVHRYLDGLVEKIEKIRVKKAKPSRPTKKAKIVNP